MFLTAEPSLALFTLLTLSWLLLKTENRVPYHFQISINLSPYVVIPEETGENHLLFILALDPLPSNYRILTHTKI